MEITLRPWQTQDAPALQQLCADVDRSYLSDRLPSPYTLEDARQWLSYVRIREEERQGIFRAIWADGRIVGNISIECQADVRRRDGELGYLLDRSCWSRGIMTQAVAMIRTQAYASLDIVRISALVYAPNTASRRVLEKTASPWKASPSMPSPKMGSSTTLISMRICAKITNDAFRHCKQREISL